MNQSINFENSLAFAQSMDQKDPLRAMRAQYHIPKQTNGEDEIYLCGNSLGLQPKKTQEYLGYELSQWQKLGVKGHFSGDFPWMPYHEFLTEGFADLVGAKHSEVVAMNSLTANLHFMMVSFYRPTDKRHKILIEDHAFPSDHYAVESQIKFHGFDPKDSMLLIKPRDGEATFRTEDILKVIEEEGDNIALIMLPGVQYYTGQVFDMQAITEAGHQKGCVVGFDLAHAAGNIEMQLHDWQVDFACWCNYKYLNSGAGSVAGCFVHETHSALRAAVSQPAFRDQLGSQTVHVLAAHPSPAQTSVALVAQQHASFCGGEAFVQRIDWQVVPASEALAELPSTDGNGRLAAVHIIR